MFKKVNLRRAATCLLILLMVYHGVGLRGIRGCSGQYMAERTIIDRGLRSIRRSRSFSRRRPIQKSTCSTA